MKITVTDKQRKYLIEKLRKSLLSSRGLTDCSGVRDEQIIWHESGQVQGIKMVLMELLPNNEYDRLYFEANRIVDHY